MADSRQAVLPGVPGGVPGLDAGWGHEARAWTEGFAAVAGMDEVGRGALAGPVLAAAVVFRPQGRRPRGLRDSKLLPASRREELASEIRAGAASVGLGTVPAEEIDRTDILAATLVAMGRALDSLQPAPDLLLLDALRLPGRTVPQRRLVGGDRLCATIAAASVIAKVERDRVMVEFERTYPYYGFGRHKGYRTREHLEALQRLGPSPIHRRTFLRMERGERGPTLF